jgi:metallophosphoesterase (TIGR00282 family)
MPVKTLTILCIGDVFGEPGRRALVTFLPQVKSELQVDLVVANVENAAAGFGVTPALAKGFLEAGVDVMTSGNHIWDRKEIFGYIVKENLLLRPANYPAGTPGVGSVVVKAGAHQVGVLNLQGRTFMASIDCPFAKADEELLRLRTETSVIVVDMHAEATSEKQAMGWYLDGRVSAVVGTHSHVQTADERILTQGTAYLTDLGLTGPIDSVIGVEPELAIQRFRTGMPSRFEPARGRARFQGAVIRIDPDSGRALSIERVQRDLPA